MAQKLLKRKPHKVTPGRARSPSAQPPAGGSRSCATVSAVLVGTYKAKQLAWIKRHGIYNYPVKDGDEFDEKSFASIKELWLYADVKGTRHVFEAEFVGVKTRDELVNEYGYPANGVFGRVERVERVDGRGKRPACPKSHGSRYYVFKTTPLDYGSRLDDPFVIARTADFGGRSAKVKKAIEQFKADGEFVPLEHYLPSDLAKVPRNRLRVCEAAVQLKFNLFSSMELLNGDEEQNYINSFATEVVPVREIPVSAMSMEEIKDRIFQGDCLKILPMFPAASIDMILCDLPYGTTQNKWDSVIPLDSLWNEYMRVLKPNGSVVLTSQGLFTAKLVLSNPDWFKYKIVWVKSKPTNFLNAKVQPLRKHEDVCVFYGRRCTYNPVMGEGVPYDKGVRKNQLSGSYGDFRPVHVQSDGKRYPTDVVYFKTAESEGAVWHPTQKPVELGRYLVKTFSNPGEIVLDNAFGSGSFLLAAAMEGRHFVGIEKNEDVALFKEGAIDYMGVAMSRLNGVLMHREVS